jgi:glucan biosynthesis protein C
MAPVKRLYYLDNLRVALIILVIAHHVGQAYGPTGGFWPIQEATRASILGPFFTVNRSFFMSLFFMISGYFTVMACDDKRLGAFFRSRLLRLGMPVLVFGLVMIPVQLFLLKPADGGSPSAWPVDVGHLWFLEHLLIFSGVYVLWRMYRKTPSATAIDGSNPPGYLAIVVFALLLAVVSGVVRIWFPIDKWVYLLGFIKVAFADVPRDLSFFIIGVLAYRRGWIENFSTRAGYIWLSVGLALSVVWSVYALVGWNYFPLGDVALGVIYPIWEAFLCCGMCIGLTVLFRERLNFQNRISKALAKSQYSAYIFHVFIVLLVQLAVVSLVAPPLVKFILVTIASVPLTFLFSNWVRVPLRL